MKIVAIVICAVQFYIIVLTVSALLNEYAHHIPRDRRRNGAFKRPALAIIGMLMLQALSFFTTIFQIDDPNAEGVLFFRMPLLAAQLIVMFFAMR